MTLPTNSSSRNHNGGVVVAKQRTSRQKQAIYIVMLAFAMTIVVQFLSSTNKQELLSAAISRKNEVIPATAATTTMQPAESWYTDMVQEANANCPHTFTFFHYFLPHAQCRNPQRVGKCMDGSKWICMDYMDLEHKTSKRALALGEKCVVYSFGSSNNACFETALVNDVLPNCEIHIFDPTSEEIPHEHWTYHSYGLTGHNASDTRYWDWRTQRAGECRNCPMQNLQQIMKSLGHSHIDILKIDIDGAEWRSLEFVYDVMKTLPADQVQIELTGLDITPNINQSLAKGGLAGVYELWHNLLFRDQFKLFHLEYNVGTCRSRSKEQGVSVEYALWRGL